jgi:hypothetical protein
MERIWDRGLLGFYATRVSLDRPRLSCTVNLTWKTWLNDSRTSAVSALPRPNKRFLSSVIRQVDDHNTALLREQAIAAKEASQDLLVASSSEDRRDSRAKEKVPSSTRSIRPAGAARLFGGALGAASSSKSRQCEVERERHGKRERSPSRKEQKVEGRRHEARKREDIRSPERDDRENRLPREDPDRISTSTSTRRRSRSRESRRHRDRESVNTTFDEVPTGQTSSSGRATYDRSPARSPHGTEEGLPRSPIRSKMDRYFEATYDPKLDPTGVLPIPSEGMVPDVGWDNMLAILKEKGKKVCQLQ